MQVTSPSVTIAKLFIYKNGEIYVRLQLFLFLCKSDLSVANYCIFLQYILVIWVYREFSEH